MTKVTANLAQEIQTLSWAVYMVRCRDNSLYTGIARDVERRVREHNSDDQLAAKYTRARRPVILVYHEASPSRSAASKRESLIKRMTRQQKEALLLCSPPAIPSSAGESAFKKKTPRGS